MRRDDCRFEILVDRYNTRHRSFQGRGNAKCRKDSKGFSGRLGQDIGPH